jgi:hypothetical protein
VYNTIDGKILYKGLESGQNEDNESNLFCLKQNWMTLALH